MSTRTYQGTVGTRFSKDCAIALKGDGQRLLGFRCDLQQLPGEGLYYAELLVRFDAKMQKQLSSTVTTQLLILSASPQLNWVHIHSILHANFQKITRRTEIRVE